MTSLLTALASSNIPSASLLDHVERIRGEILERGIEMNVHVYNALMQAYGRAMRLDLMLGVFAELKASKVRPDAATYSTLIHACGAAKDIKGALALFDEAARTLRGDFDTRLVVTMLTACKDSPRASDAERGVDLLQEYFFPADDAQPKMTPDIFAFTIGLVLCLRTGNGHLTRTLLDRLERGTVPLDAFIIRPMLQACCLLRDLPRAERIWATANDARVRTVYSYETMVQTYVRLGNATKGASQRAVRRRCAHTREGAQRWRRLTN